MSEEDVLLDPLPQFRSLIGSTCVLIEPQTGSSIHVSLRRS